VTSQVYGQKKASQKGGDQWLAHSVDRLMIMNPSFRIAYIDSATKLHYSVLLRAVHDPSSGTDSIVEVYRVRLPVQSESSHGVVRRPRVSLLRWGWRCASVAAEAAHAQVLGEGKPENQNHAAIFCFGEALQTVDMNQDNCLAEALKMRCLLQEFETDGPQELAASSNVASFYKDVTAQVAKRTTALVGFREYIFSNTVRRRGEKRKGEKGGQGGLLSRLRVFGCSAHTAAHRTPISHKFHAQASSIGAFAAGSEFAFGTIVQRTMANPGGVRFHYGHPDVWNKLFTMTRGGVSKATRAFHISEARLWLGLLLHTAATQGR